VYLRWFFLPSWPDCPHFMDNGKTAQGHVIHLLLTAVLPACVFCCPLFSLMYCLWSCLCAVIMPMVTHQHAMP
jgi:hypothetical protein